MRADLGESDANYIRSLIEFHRRLAALSRIVLMASRYPPAWLLGTTMVTLVLLARPGGMRRGGGATIIVLYFAFVVGTLVGS